jgi:alkylation response protein AidB-like acyl-CoA dehydrogenase
MHWAIPRLWRQQQDKGWQVAVKATMMNQTAPPPPPLFTMLLISARHLSESELGGAASAAVMIAQTAIEVCTERAISRLLAGGAAAFLHPWIDRRLSNYNVYREDVKGLYKVVTEDVTITDQGFWTSGRLKAHVELRNDIAHRGKTATAQEAMASVVVAEEIINHMVGVAAKKSVNLGD